MKLFYLAFLHYYTGFVGFLVYLFSSKIFFIKKYKSDYIFILLLLLFFTAQALSFSFSEIILNARFFWGWFIFYLIFNYYNFPENFSKLLFIICCITSLEAVLINTFIDASSLPNFPKNEGWSISHFADEGAYQRPYSIGGNASVTSSIIVVLMAILGSSIQNKLKIFSIFNIIILSSGTGFIILFIYLFISSFNNLKSFLFASPIYFLFPLIFFGAFALEGSIFSKIGIIYLSGMINYIELQFYELIDFQSISGFLVGRGYQYEELALIGRGGDNGIFSFIIFNGFIGLAILLILILRNISSKSLVPIVLIIISTFHYPTMFFLPGQILFGYLLSMKSK